MFQSLCEPAGVGQQGHRSSSEPSSEETGLRQELLSVRLLGGRGDQGGLVPVCCRTVF